MCSPVFVPHLILSFSLALLYNKYQDNVTLQTLLLVLPVAPTQIQEDTDRKKLTN